MSNTVKSHTVEEGEAVDEVVHGGLGVHAANQLLGVVAEQLKGGNHGQAAVGQLLGLGLLELLSGLALALGVTEDEEAPVVDGADEEDHLEPAKGGDGLDGGNAVGDRGERHARGDVTGELEHLGHDVAKDGKLGNTAVLELGSAVLVEGLLVDVGGQAQGVKEAHGGDGAELVLVRHLEGRAAAHARHGGESSGRAEGKEDGGAIGVEIGRGVL